MFPVNPSRRRSLATLGAHHNSSFVACNHQHSQQVVEDPNQAGFILAHGTEAVGLPGGGTQDRSLQQLQGLLEQCAAVAKQRGTELPMIVANPDLVSFAQWVGGALGWAATAGKGGRQVRRSRQVDRGMRGICVH